MPPNVATMKKAPSKSSKVSAKQVTASRSRRRVAAPADELRPHYDFDYAKSRPNRFADRLTEETVAVVLDPDVASVFRSSEAVNAFLRSVITAMPAAEPRKRKRPA